MPVITIDGPSADYFEPADECWACWPSEQCYGCSFDQGGYLYSFLETGRQHTPKQYFEVMFELGPVLHALPAHIDTPF